MQIRLIVVLCLFFSFACRSKNKKAAKNGEVVADTVAISEPNDVAPLMVYKTKENYNHLVPVLLNAEKTEIISYPQISDLVLDTGFAYPIELKNGYLLDRRGINSDVAFLNLSYRSYTYQRNLPTLDALFNNIIDKDPLISLCNCSQLSNDSNLVSQLNALIERDALREKCKVLK